MLVANEEDRVSRDKALTVNPFIVGKYITKV